MASIELDAFVEQQRAKLKEERASIGSEVSSRGNGTSLGISEHENRREQLRNERKREYQQLMSSKKSKSSSIAETRRKLADEREAELLDGRNKLNSRELGHSERPKHESSSRRDESYSELRERKRREEKQYRAGLMDYSPEHSSPRGRTVSFAPQDPQDREPRKKWAEGGAHIPGRRQWDDEEDQYLQWTRNKGRYSGHSRDRRANTPPGKLHNSRDDIDEDESSRSRSAPSTHAPDFMNLNKRSTEDEKRAKKQAYAEELKRQMMENDEAKAKEKAEMFGYLPTRKEDEKRQSKDRKEKAQQRRSTESPPPSRYSSPGPGHPYDRAREDSNHYHAPAPFHPPNGNPAHPPHPYSHFGYMPQHLPYPGNPYNYYFPPPPQSGALVPPPPPPHHPHYSQYDSYYGRPESPSKRHSSVRVRTPNEESHPSGSMKSMQAPLKDSSNDSSAQRVSPRGPLGRDAYRAELERQINEKKQKQLQNHAKREEFDKKKNEEIKLYDPWGKGGCGAPIRDATGKPVTDLRKLRIPNDSKGSPGNVSDGDLNNSLEVYTPKRDPSRLGSHSPYEAPFQPQQEPAPKSQQEEYRKDLMRQMEEKENLKRKEKEKLQQEEEREVQRLEMERKKLQEDFEREQQKQKAKEEETKAKNELLKHVAEQKRLTEKENARKLQEQDSQELEMARRREAEQRYIRPPSPPVPAVKNHLVQQGQPFPARRSTTPAQLTYQAHPPFTQARGSSPPVPALRKKEAGNQDSTYASSLQVTEGPTDQQVYPVQTLVRERTHSIAHEPKVYPQPPQLRAPRGSEQPAVLQVDMKQTGQPEWHPDSESKQLEEDRGRDVLDRLSAMRRLLKDAKSKAPSVASSTTTEGKRSSDRGPGLLGPVRVDARKLSSRARITRGDTQQNPIDTFNQLKYSKPDSLRREFLARFPEPPRSESSLEVQQAELLKHQEEILSKLQLAANQPCKPSQESQPSGDLLPSETVYVEPTTSRESRTSHRSARRRTWQIGANFGGNVGTGDHLSAPRPVSQASTTSFDLDAVAERNKDRLRRLDVVLKSSQNNTDRSPDDVIQNFLDSATPYAPQLDAAETLSRMSEQSLPNNTTFKPVFP